METISSKIIKNILPKRKADSHKGTYGKVLIVAGSEGMAGASVLSARGALRSGAGLVRVSIDKMLFPIVQGAAIEATCVDRSLTADELAGYDSVMIGPGLGRSQQGMDAFAKVVQGHNGNLVMDADALNIAAENKVNLRNVKANLIITPHVGEAARLMGVSTAEVNEDREKSAVYLSRLTGAISVLKGHDTLICVPDNDEDKKHKIYVNPTGNPGMATGGSGDVLAGIIGSLLGQGIGPAEAAMAGVYVHGLAGDLAAEDIGEYGITAGDIAEYTAKAIRRIQEEK